MSGEDASKPGKADPDFDPVLEEKNMTKEQHARAIRADRGGENPEQSLLDALEDYIILCGGEPLEDVSRLRIDIALQSTRYRLSRIRGYHSGPYPRPDRAFRRAPPRGARPRFLEELVSALDVGACRSPAAAAALRRTCPDQAQGGVG